MTNSEIISLQLFKNLQGAITEEEKAQLNAWVSANPDNQMLFEELTNEDSLPAAISGYHPDNRRALETRILERIKDRIPTLKVVAMQRRSFFRVAVAASIVLMLGLVGYLYFNKGGKKVDIAKTDLQRDIKAPATNRATITKANGEKVYLDSAGNGTLATEGNVKVIKTADGKIVYSGFSKEVVYNTLTNPRGSKVIDMTLADGSRVWLNAGSSVTYPVAFAGNERKVVMSGEAYFEVSHDASMPFKVSKGAMEITVLGTHFNVNAYDDEENIKVTLLEGSVKINKGSSSGLLKPGQQAQISDDIKMLNEVNTAAVMAWKNGYFNFDNADIGIVMRQVARWYDVEVVYEGPKPSGHYGGEVPRDVSVNEMLKVIKVSGVDFKIDGKKIIITR